MEKNITKKDIKLNNMIEISNNDRLLILEVLEILMEDLENMNDSPEYLKELEGLYKRLVK